jgi:hypothetical protein
METDNEYTADAIRTTLISPNEQDSRLAPANVVDGLFAIARSMDRVAIAIERLGVGNANTDMGAIELLSKEVKDGLQQIWMAMPVSE